MTRFPTIAQGSALTEHKVEDSGGEPGLEELGFVLTQIYAFPSSMVVAVDLPTGISSIYMDLTTSRLGGGCHVSNPRLVRATCK